MAKITRGIFGPLTGKIGNLIAQNWKEINYLRPAPVKSKKPRTADRLANESKFGFFNNWTKPFYPYFQVGFRHMASEKTELNIGFSENYRRALSGTAPDFVIDYQQVILSLGKLPGVNNVVMSRTADNELVLKWDANNYHIKSSHNDQLFLAVYAPALQEIDGFLAGVKRTAEKCTFQMLDKFRNEPLEIFIGLTSFNGKRVSNSKYLGRIEPV